MAIPFLAGAVSVSAYGAKVSVGVITLSTTGVIAVATPIAIGGVIVVGVMIYRRRDKSASRGRAAAARRPP